MRPGDSGLCPPPNGEAWELMPPRPHPKGSLCCCHEILFSAYQHVLNHMLRLCRAGRADTAFMSCSGELIHGPDLYSAICACVLSHST